MDTLEIFFVQFVMSLIVFTLFAKWFVSPWLSKMSVHLALVILIIPHTFRHLGLAFLVPGLVAENLSSTFAYAAAYGDFISGLLALFSMIALRGGWRLAFPMVWFFNIVGTVDLLNALRQAEAVPHLLTTWYIPTFWVPLLLVTHFMIFVWLRKPGNRNKGL